MRAHSLISTASSVDSPFHAFARVERAQGLIPGTLRRINATNGNHNALARLERYGGSTYLTLGILAALWESQRSGSGLRAVVVLPVSRAAPTADNQGVDQAAVWSSPATS